MALSLSRRMSRFPLLDFCCLVRPVGTLLVLGRRRQVSSAFPRQKPTGLGMAASDALEAPLYLRPPNHTCTQSDLQKWYSWATDLAKSVGSNFSESDNGPDSTLLCREVNWLLEDVVDIEPKLQLLGGSKSMSSNKVELKVGLEHLYSLWRQRVEERRPLQYIVGCEHWRDLVLTVQQGVLIPRPETEIIVDLVADLLLSKHKFNDGLWVDLGTGSGAIAIAIARILGASARVIATDLSPVAVRVASFNVQTYHLQEKVEVREGCWFEAVKDVEGSVDGLVSNPPYIPSQHISGLQAEVGRHEPRLALDGGSEGGLDHLLHLCNGAASLLKPGGYFAFETNGEKQCHFLVDYIETKFSTSFHNINVVSDFAGIERFITGFRK